MNQTDLEKMMFNFERWFHKSEWFDTVVARWELGGKKLERCAALLESAVLDELERLNGWGINIEPTEVNLFSRNTSGTHTKFVMHKGHGPNRLARLHDACKKAFGDAP